MGSLHPIAVPHGQEVKLTPFLPIRYTPDRTRVAFHCGLLDYASGRANQDANGAAHRG